jgi:hypothetical protein
VDERTLRRIEQHGAKNLVVAVVAQSMSGYKDGFSLFACKHCNYVGYLDLNTIKEAQRNGVQSSSTS